ncbi:MAG: HAMP domain-containing sensor histidine kinase [Burkholderiaceae bacterium]|nr:HAMP domain-containing sensor histidine kinase [Burkholderiaceae bacterium]
MKFGAFIKDNLDAIVADWEAFATKLPAGRTMSALALRDHSQEILLAIAADMELRHSDQERADQSQDIVPTRASTTSAAAEHGVLRQMAGFDLVQLFAEFRAMRASVMAFWQRSEDAATGSSSTEELARFNEGMDKALAQSVQRYSSEVAASRDMFLAVLGHDLRGPLSGIVMSAMVLAKPDLSDAARQQAAARIKRASREMNRLITDLLEYTRTRLGAGIPIDRSACDLGPVCEAALEDIRAGNPEQQFVQQMSGNLNLQADAARMQQALSNLLSNAVQHGNRLSPVTLTAVGEVDAIVLKVSNSGDPIPADALQAIFEPLVQAPNASSEAHERSKTSLGLGLFIVREIVLAHGGTISVESSAEAGTVFTIRLPRAPG